MSEPHPIPEHLMAELLEHGQATICVEDIAPQFPCPECWQEIGSNGNCDECVEARYA